jgi:uncharacterized protein (UPF0218 family)
MAFVGLTKQLAQQAIQSAIQDPAPAAPTADNPGAVMLNQVGAMQKALKDDEELVVYLQGAEKIRVMEIFLPSAQVAVLTGIDANRVVTRVVSAVSALQLLVRTGKVQPGSKAVRLNLVMPKSKDGK